MKVVVVKQRDFHDCGCCCLQSIIKYYGGFVPLEKIRSDTQTGKGGTRAYHLVETAKKYGFNSNGKRVGFANLTQEIMPLIAHVTYPNGLVHYVVVYQIKTDKVTIMDPAVGKKILPKTEFVKIWTNVIIIFHPKNQIVKFPRNKSAFSFFRQYIIKYKKRYFRFILINIILMLVILIGGCFVSLAIAQITNLKLLLLIMVFFGILIIFKIILIFLKNQNEAILGNLLNYALMSDFNYHLFHLPSNIMLNRTTGEIMTRVQELETTKDLFTQVFISLFLDSILAFCSLILLMIIDFKITGFIILIYLIYFFINFWGNKPVYRGIEAIMEKDSVYNNNLIESINNLNSIKNLNVTGSVVQKINTSLQNLNDQGLTLTRKLNRLILFKNIIGEIGIFIITAVGLYWIYQKRFELQTFLLFTSILAFFESSFKNVVDVFPKMSYFKVSFDKISEFYTIEEERPTRSGLKFKPGNICYKDVSLTFDGYNYFLNNLNLTFNYKQHTLLTGISGIGKSSALKCLINHIKYRGDIYISNVNIKDYDDGLLRKNILYIDQNEKLFSDTIYNNITCFDQVSNQRFYEICKICCVDEIIAQKPFRYMSQIDDELNCISGGERQRIILARGLLKKFEILILDEALSEVDYQTEKKIIQNIHDSFSYKTIVYVSHKKLEDCFDKVICLNDSRRYNE